MSDGSGADPISAAESIVGSIFKGITGFVSSSEQAHAYSVQQHQDKLLGSVNAGEAIAQGDQVAARAATQAAANGGGLGGGASGMGLIAEASQRAEFNGRVQIYRGMTEANNALYNEDVAKDNALNSAIGTLSPAFSESASQYAIAQDRSQMLNSFAASHGEAQDPFYGLN